MLIPLLQMFTPKTIEKLRSLLPYQAKETAFRKVMFLFSYFFSLFFSFLKLIIFFKIVMTTMVRDRQHGPVVELRRFGRRTRSSTSAAGRTVFAQMVQRLPLLTQEALSLPHRVWKVKFVGKFFFSYCLFIFFYSEN